jgi:hypothetical protein
VNISEEAVEAAAKAIYAEGAYCGNCEYAGWDTCGDCRTCCISYAKAAAPYMLAPAKAEGWRVGYEQGWKDGGDSERTGEDYGPHRTNPYRSQA